MANANVPRGLTPKRHRNGEPYSGSVTRYYVPASDSTAIFIGDPVTITGSADANGVAAVTRSTAAGGSYITGVVQGIDLVGSNVGFGFSNRYRPASAEMYLLVADNPDLVFEIQEDSVGGALAAADIGLNADLIIAAGSTYTGESAAMLDTSTKATTATLQLKILGLVQRPDNEVGSLAKVEVMINLHTHRQVAGN